jgi:hypothetical protein
MDELELAVREAVGEMQRSGDRERVRLAARDEAVRLYGSEQIAIRLGDVLREIADAPARRDHPGQRGTIRGVHSPVSSVRLLSRSRL